MLAAALALATALLAVTFGVATSSAPAGNRDATASFESFPGPAEVTFGKNVSYRASLKNDSGSTFTQVRFKMTRPCVSEATPLACKNFGTTAEPSYLYASLVYSSCASTPTGPFTVPASGYECPAFPNQPAGSPGVDVTLVWQTPLLPENTTCAGCVLWTIGTWTLKESNNTTPSTDTYSNVETNKLLEQPDPKKAAGYALGAVKTADCTTDTANVVTHQIVGSSNKIATAVCAGSVPGTLVNPGLVVEVNEAAATSADPFGFTEVSDICIPAAGDDCPTTTPYQFNTPGPPATPDLATFIFKIPESAYPNWPNGEKLDVAYHNGLKYDEYICTFDRDGKTKVWTITCPADENGSWRFG